MTLRPEHSADRATDSPLPHPRSVARYGDADDGVLLPERPDWHAYAGCHPSRHPDSAVLWAQGRRVAAARAASTAMFATDTASARRAQHVCAGCPFVATCAASRRPDDRDGTWGGQTYVQDARNRSRLTRLRSLGADCGSMTGVRTHQRDRTPLCDACRAAEAAYRRGRRTA